MAAHSSPYTMLPFIASLSNFQKSVKNVEENFKAIKTLRQRSLYNCLKMFFHALVKSHVKFECAILFDVNEGALSSKETSSKFKHYGTCCFPIVLCYPVSERMRSNSREGSVRLSWPEPIGHFLVPGLRLKNSEKT